MKFKEAAQIFEKIETTSSRTEITELLAGLLKKSSAQDARILSYVVLGTLNPPYESTNFAIAQKTMKKIVARFLEVSENIIDHEVAAIGDIGSVIGRYTWEVEHALTVQEVFDALKKIESIEGSGSQDLKIIDTCALLKKLDSVSAKYVIRIILGTLRLGLSDMTLLDALSWMETGSKSLRKDLEHAYTVCADSGQIAYDLKKHGIDAIRDLKIHVGIPIRPAAAERLKNPTEIIEKLGECVAEPKLDGFRLQIHLDFTHKTPIIKFFSRNLLDMTAMFPEFIEMAKKLDVKTLIADGEAIVFDANTGSYLPFQETVKRRRKHGVEQMSSELPLQLNLFDILYLDGESLLHKPLYTRRDILKELYVGYIKNMEQHSHTKKNSVHQLSLISNENDVQDAYEKNAQRLFTLQIVDEIHVKTAQELNTYFLQEIGEGLEGVMVKKINSTYQAGKRNFNWIKLKYEALSKLDDSIDAVILGYYSGKGKRAHFGIGAFLVGVYNEKLNVFQTLAKVGTGLKDAEWEKIKALCDKHKVEIKPKDVECAKELTPTVWVSPILVCEILADEITLSPAHTAGKTASRPGYALRFPRFYRYRNDKNAYQTTSVEQLEKMYKDQ